MPFRDGCPISDPATPVLLAPSHHPPQRMQGFAPATTGPSASAFLLCPQYFISCSDWHLAGPWEATVVIEYIHSARSWTSSGAWILYNQYIIVFIRLTTAWLLYDFCVTFLWLLFDLFWLREIQSPVESDLCQQKSYYSHAIVEYWKSDFSLKWCRYNFGMTLYDFCLTNVKIPFLLSVPAWPPSISPLCLSIKSMSPPMQATWGQEQYSPSGNDTASCLRVYDVQRCATQLPCPWKGNAGNYQGIDEVEGWPPGHPLSGLHWPQNTRKFPHPVGPFMASSSLNGVHVAIRCQDCLCKRWR